MLSLSSYFGNGVSTAIAHHDIGPDSYTDIIAYFLSRDVRRRGHHQSDLRSVASEIIGMAKTGDSEWKSIIGEVEIE